jgi:hypothetical protein
MRFCNHCQRMTTGEPSYCNFCGRSYDLKLCPHRHANPRTAEVCSQCGSRELSTPQPRVSLWLAPLLALLSVLPGLVLLGVSILLLAGFVQTAFTNQQLLFQFLLLALMIGGLWWLYMHLPGFLRRGLTRLFSRHRDRNDHHGH